MIAQDSLLVMLVNLIDRIPEPPQPPQQRGRGRPWVYTERLFLKALVIMIVKHVYTASALLSILAQETPEMRELRVCLTEHGRFPTRRTWERRLDALPASLPAYIGCFGRELVRLIQPWIDCGRAAAMDSTVLRAKGGVWHQKDREVGVIPHGSIDTEAHWTKSGWHGWVYGWKLHLVTTVAAVWIPLAAELTPANTADSQMAALLLEQLPSEVRYLFGDRHYNRDEVRDLCLLEDRILVTSHYGCYPHHSSGVEVRRVLHRLRSSTIENFNEQFKGIFDVHGQVPTKGLIKTQLFALGAIFVYQLTLLYRFEHHLDLRVGLKAFLKAA